MHPDPHGVPVRERGQPGGTSGNIIGSTPSGSAYLSPWSVSVSGTTWYAINYNHRQEWVPASEVSSTRTHLRRV